MRCSCCSMTN
ncbi:MAG: hypothetical protein EP343_20295 [Deltaproteobacteria bacterium]|nr:MAG: hypothetical protein EP343_20295 [Deltaproteobacteria bacterium]